jgi:hypothetical protein
LIEGFAVRKKCVFKVKGDGVPFFIGFAELIEINGWCLPGKEHHRGHWNLLALSAQRLGSRKNKQRHKKLE